MCDGADGADGFGARDVAREEHVEGGEGGLLEPGEEGEDLGGGGAGARELAVAGVVTWGRG